MVLSSDEKTQIKAAYERVRLSKKFQSGVAVIFMGYIPALASVVQIVRDPHASHRLILICSGSMGLVLGFGLLSLVVAPSLRKRDEALVRLAERHFSEDCVWKQDERILAEAEDIRLKAIVELDLHKAVR